MLFKGFGWGKFDKKNETTSFLYHEKVHPPRALMWRYKTWKIPVI